MKAALILLLVSLGIALPAYADRIGSKKNWALDEIDTASGKLCIASTTVKENKSQYTLEVHKLKNSSSPVEVILREVGEQQIGPMAYGSINNEKTLFNEYAVSGNTKFFWYLPDEMSLVMWSLKANSEFDLRPVYKSSVGDIDFSLKGSSEMIGLMESRCNNKQELVVERLALLTNHSDSFDANPQSIDARRVANMRAIYFQLAAKLNEVIKVEVDLEKLIAKYRPQIDERKALKNEKSQLETSVIPGIKNDQAYTSQRLNETQGRLRQLKSLIPQAANAKSQAQAAYDAAYNKIAPHVPRHRQLVSELNNASNELDSAENALADVISEIRSNRNEIQNLSGEASNLEYRMRSLRADLGPTRREMEEARRNLSAYNPAAEKRRQLNQTPGYNQKKTQEQALTQDLNQAKNQAARAQDRVQGARQELNSCKSVAGADCSGQQAALAQALQVLNDKRAQANSIQSQLNTVKNEVNRIENQVNQQVNREHRRLENIFERAENRYQNIANELDRTNRRHDNIVRVLIPDLRQRNQYLLDRQAALDSDISYLERKVASALSALNNFKASVGYDQLEAKLEQTQNALRNAANHLADLQSEQSRLTQLEISDQNRLIQLADDLSKNQKRLAAVNARIGTLNGILAQFDAAKTPLEKNLKSLNVQLSTQQASYLANIP